MITIRTSPIPSTSYKAASSLTQKTEIAIQTEELEPKKTITKNLLTPTVLPAICTIPWTPPSPEARTAFLLMHHKQLTSVQIKSSILHSLLTPEQLQKTLSCHTQYTHYSSKRIIYLSTASQEKPETDPQQKWEELFTSKVSRLSDIPDPQSAEEYYNFLRSKQEQMILQRRIDKNAQLLLSKLELGTINYEEYYLLRTSFLNLQLKGITTSKSLFFPGIAVCNNPQYGKVRKFINPIFLLASIAFLSIVPKPSKTSQILNIEQSIAIQKLQNGDFVSLMDLEETASCLAPSTYLSKLKKLINHSLAILEQRKILPLIGPINDVTQHNNQPNLPLINQTNTQLTILDNKQSTSYIHETSSPILQITNIYDKPSTSTIGSSAQHTPLLQAKTLEPDVHDKEKLEQSTNSWTESKPQRTTTSMYTSTISEIVETTRSSSIMPRRDHLRRATMQKLHYRATTKIQCPTKTRTRRRKSTNSKITRSIAQSLMNQTISTTTIANQPRHIPENKKVAFMSALSLTPTINKHS